MKHLFASFLVLFALSLSAQESERVRDIIYTKHDGVALTMDVFKPAKPNGAGIIKIVSGGWKSNHKGISDGGWPKAGYTTFVVVHGTQPRFQVEEIVADLNRAVRFVRTNAATYGVDPQKLGVTGSSAGGHLSLMLATRGGPGDRKAADPIDRESSAVNAVACFYPPTDYLNWFEPGDNAVASANSKPTQEPLVPKPRRQKVARHSGASCRRSTGCTKASRPSSSCMATPIRRSRSRSRSVF
jgi:acetyl esterase/lipase